MRPNFVGQRELSVFGLAHLEGAGITAVVHFGAPSGPWGAIGVPGARRCMQRSMRCGTAECLYPACHRVQARAKVTT